MLPYGGGERVCLGKALAELEIRLLAVGLLKQLTLALEIEKVFGWIKQWGGLRQFKLRGTEKVGAVFGLHVIAYNLIRLGNLLKPAMAAA